MLPSSKFKTAVDTVKVLTPQPCSIGCASTASIQPCPSFILNWALPSRIESVKGAISTVTSTESSPERLGISFFSAASESESPDFPVCPTFSSTFSWITSIFSAISSVPPHAITANKLTKTKIILKYFILIILFILYILIVLNFE